MGRTGKIVEVCVSERKGERKTPVGRARLVADQGLEGDAHAGTGRQVSLLCQESIRKMQGLGLEIGPGDFAENLTVGGLSASHFEPGTRIRISGPEGEDSALLEVTQVGKQCHAACAIREAIGDCVMPREGIFARVIRGGLVEAGSTLEVSDED